METQTILNILLFESKEEKLKKKKKLVREAENSPILMYSKLKLLLEKYALVKFKLRGRMQGE